ncbi:sigma-70 family RNA polymerase sigma factor [Sphingobacterium alkalisoli]|uniref:Sigma-70 family RNA polymerase sigma factor n=1 Tax=Sphingobacterium alkalisoli TaxID=1874115 RepID=A0A4U0GVY3_9SPHI|nr:sigma-70 family RNA polymerase sigma factor [Sphingobacterium alkalisoli]TJY62764.1 sigma-70 family RNA polymerase sigma factor [Sphingobacterium alkalisoli]GGH28732.1 DNA-directed RNA polymerase sigma-70 factor [Sphingobacterium alkalisoli]
MKDESQWWEMFRMGDEASFKSIFERYQSLLFNYGYKFTQDENLIDDCVQELFVKLWYNRENLGDTASVKNYLFKSFRRILSRKLERASRFLSLQTISSEKLPFDIELPSDVDLMRKERLAEIRQQLSQALDKMSPRQREIIHLRYFEEMTYEEIADVMGLSIKDTYKLFYRAMDSLRKHIGKINLLALLSIVGYLRSS